MKSDAIRALEQQAKLIDDVVNPVFSTSHANKTKLLDVAKRINRRANTKSVPKSGYIRFLPEKRAGGRITTIDLKRHRVGDVEVYHTVHHGIRVDVVAIQHIKILQQKHHLKQS